MNRLLRGSLLIMVWACARPAYAQTLTLENYRSKLAGIGAALENGDLAQVQRGSKELAGAQIKMSGGYFESDSALLTPLTDAKNISDAELQLPRVKALLDALGKSVETQSSALKVDAHAREELERLRRDEAVDLPAKDGEVAGDELVNSGFFKALREALTRAGQWLLEVGQRFFRWLRDLFPSAPEGGAVGGISSFVLKIVVVAFAAAAVIIAFYVLRKNKRNETPLVGSKGAPALSSKDADPTSRNASQWEEYAAKLAAAGQHREAIRACYHAVLAALFRAGALHYRKGRTNWEYCYALPQSAWREGFLNLTRFFEHEWYGKYQSAPEDFTQYSAATKQLLERARGADNKRGAALW